jgi:hypothetical protein
MTLCSDILLIDYLFDLFGFRSALFWPTSQTVFCEELTLSCHYIFIMIKIRRNFKKSIFSIIICSNYCILRTYKDRRLADLRNKLIAFKCISLSKTMGHLFRLTLYSVRVRIDEMENYYVFLSSFF